MRAVALESRAQSAGEEIANALSHSVGLLLTAAAIPIARPVVPQAFDGSHAGPLAVFALTMFVVYAASVAYHALPAGSLKRWMHRLDHAAIFLFIAGSYTPFMLGVLRDDAGPLLLCVVWAVSLAGAAAKMCGRLTHPLGSTAFYVGLGWMALLLARPLVERVPAPGLAWIVGGGLLYTLGAIVFLFDSRVRYGHCVWHLFVLAGSACHFVAVVQYSQPV